MRILPVITLLVALLLAPAWAKDEAPGTNLLANGSFEQVVPGTPPKDAGHGAWVLGGDTLIPGGWNLNVSYPGTLTVGQDKPAEGSNAIRLEAGAKRDAQMFHPCPAMRPGTWYRVSMRVRGGTATLLTYEYTKGGNPHASTLASGTASPEAWRTVTGFYTPQSAAFLSASVTLLVPRGGAAWIDDVQVHEMGGPAAGPKARPIQLSTKACQLLISGAGQLQSLTLTGTKDNRVEARHGAPVLVATVGGVRMPVSTLTKKGSTYVARFPDPTIRVKLRIKPMGRYLRFEVLEAKPKSLESLALRFPVRGYRTRDSWMPGTYGDDGGITLMGVSPNTQTRLARHGSAVVPEARWYREQGIRGGVAALIATPDKDFLPTIRQMELDTGLPSPVLRSDHASTTGTADWARVSPAIKQSYLFATHLGFGDIDKLIQYAKVAGLGLIMLHRKSWRASGGHETIARTAFPDGLPTLQAVCKRIHAAGLGVGLHLYGPAVATHDAYVTPVPDKRLFAYEVTKLAAPAGADATELRVASLPPLPRQGAADLHPGNLLRLGDEIIRWTKIVPGTPVRITGCERGALGTKAVAHRKNASVRALVLRNGGLLVDPDSTLPDEMGTHLARVVNACQADLVYFDACAAAAPGHKPENWYYLNKVLLASCAKFDHGVLVQTGMGPGRQLAWHLVPRSASADGHGDLKHYLDQRTAGILQMRRTHTAADIGWYALDIHGRPDELEYVCAKALALDGSISVQGYKGLLESHPRAREVFEMIGSWERRRRAGDVPEKMKALIRAKGRDVHLVETDDAWSLWEASYEDARPIRLMDGKANLWKVTNDRKQEVTLSVEIERIVVAATPADHRGAGSVSIDPFAEAGGFKLRDDEALSPYILLGGRADQADGFARRGVKTALKEVQDAAVGGKALSFTVASSIGGAGWGGAGKTFATPLDLSAAKSIGLWVHGDGHGASCTVTLADTKGSRARFTTTLDYTGWRFQSFARKGPKALAWNSIAHLILEIGHVPPKASITARVAALRAMPTLHKPKPMPGVTIVVGRREVDLGAPLAPGQCLTIDAIGRGVFWPGGMQPGSEHMIAGGPLRVAPGANTVGLKLKDPSGYAGDLRLRVCRTWPLMP